MAVSAAFALAGSHGETKYVGKTKQHRTIRLRANAKHVRMQGFAIQLHCRNGSVLIDQESGFEPSPLRHGKFNDKQFGSTDTVIYKGRVRRGKITGTLKVRDRLGKVRCSSPTVKFTARRRGH
jgi:hypothetical protein